MAQRSHQDIITEIGRRCLSAIIRTNDAALAGDAMTAAVNGGFRMVEFTLTTPDALRLIETFAASPDLLVGAGTVLTVKQARDAANAGAEFLVSPVTDEAMIAEARRLGRVSIPGTYTPTEMVRADRLGADILKIFPAPNDIPSFVTQVLGPLPELRIFPTAGVHEANFLDTLRAGAFGAGFVSSLFTPEDMRERNLSAIERRARQIHLRWEKDGFPGRSCSPAILGPSPAASSDQKS